MKRFDLGWGESVAVRRAFLEQTKKVVFDDKALMDLNYPPHEGDAQLIELTKKVIKRQIGRSYNHVLITNGATGGVTIALRSFQRYRDSKICVINDPPFFSIYPSMIRAANLTPVFASNQMKLFYSKETVYLVDSLSNPLGQFSEMKRDHWDNPIVWDAVYYGNVYAPGNHPQPVHDVLVGSYSKLTGLNGLRVGWIACNEERGHKYMKSLVTAEYCGISAASTKIILDTAGQFTDSNWEYFEKSAQQKLDWNREEFSKLEKFFANVPVNKYGMFYYAPTDDYCKELLKKSNIIWSSGTHLGDTDNFGRFNLGQDCKVIKEAVKTILKNDKV